MAKEKDNLLTTTEITEDAPTDEELEVMALRQQINAADTVRAPGKPKYEFATRQIRNGDEVPLIYIETDTGDVWRQEFWRNKIQGGTFNSRVLKYDKSGEEVIGIKVAGMVDFLIAYHNACEIDGIPSWLDFPIGDPRNTNMYFQRVHGMRHTLMHFYEDVTRREAEDVLDVLTARLLDYPDRKYESSMDVFTTKDGTVFKTDIFATKPEDAVRVIGMVSPEHHIVQGDVLNVTYDPSITHNDFVYDALYTWAGGDINRLWRMIEANFSSGLIGPVDFKHWIINYGPAGCGKSMPQHMRDALFGSSATRNVVYRHLKNPFTIGSLAGKRFAYSDETSDAVFDSESCQIVKTLVTGGTIDGELKYENKRVPVRGQACIFCTNHLPKFPQTEASSGNLRRRMLFIRWKHVFDTGDIKTSTHDSTWKNKFEDKENKHPEYKSYMFNLILEGCRRLLVNHHYTPVPEDDALALEALDAVDTVAAFLENYPLLGAAWDTPHLVPFGDKYKQFAIVYPRAWTDDEAKKHYQLLNIHKASIFDERDGLLKDIPRDANVVAVGFTSESDIAYGAYLAWHTGEGTGSKGALSANSFGRELTKKGWSRFKAKSVLSGKNKLNIIPTSAGVTSKQEYDAFILSIGLSTFNQAPEGLRETVEDFATHADAKTITHMFEHGLISEDVRDKGLTHIDELSDTLDAMGIGDSSKDGE